MAERSEGYFAAAGRRPAPSTVDEDPRCSGSKQLKDGRVIDCRRLLARAVTRPWAIECPNCGHLNVRSPSDP